MTNPFVIKTPEANSSAQEIVDLFVDVFTDFNKVLEPGHTFLNGPRGTGKSMMFRYMQPDCQSIVTGKAASDLDFFAIYIPIKLSSINNVDMNRFEDHAGFLLNEHLLVTFVLSKSFKFIYEKIPGALNDCLTEVKAFYRYFVGISDLFGFPCPSYKSIARKKSAVSIFQVLAETMNQQYQACWRLLSSVSLSGGTYPPINLPLVNFMDYMYPLFQKLKELPCLPNNRPLYLLVDDADNLSPIQTKILNNWVSYRTVEHLCLKISTQLDYKTYQTTFGKKIDSPHDFAEVNISTVYTSNKERYYNRVKVIVEKRLKYFLGKDIQAEQFFPQNEIQERAIKEIYIKLKEQNFDAGKDYVAGDAAYRYAVPEYMKQLKRKRAASTYSYAGFRQLVSISSGVVRHFLDSASKMYSEQLAMKPSQASVSFITDSIQNSVIRKCSEDYLDNEIASLSPCIAKKIYNLVDGLGKLFQLIILSDLTERRIFSIVLNDEPDEELQEILDVGVREGLLHAGSKGSKSGLGRSRKYVLTRMVAPLYQLDPTSFAGYQSLSCDLLKKAILSPKGFVASFKKIMTNPDYPHLF